MRIKKFVVGVMQTNCYAVIDEESKLCIIIDPGAEGERIIKALEAEEVIPFAVVLTHAHFDHMGAASRLTEKYNIPLVVGELETETLAKGEYNLSAMYPPLIEMSADCLLSDGERFEFGKLAFKTIFTAGHTPGGICLYFENEQVLFSGDTLFYASAGRTDFPGGSFNQLLKSLKSLSLLPDEVIVYPGHDAATKIGFEKKNNPYLSYEDEL